MSDIGLILNGLLGALLVGALLMGWRLDRRLRALRDSHRSFTQAIGDLDRAAARAEQGLADLRAATDEATETLAGRIDRANALSAKLEKLTAEAAGAEARIAAPPRLAPVRESPIGRLAERYVAEPKAAAPTVVSPRKDLILEDAAEQRAAVVSRLDRLRALGQPRPAAPARAAPPPRPRADDELFEAPAFRRTAEGGRPVTPLPRFLPLVAVAAAGVLAINALENGPGIVGAARAFAEDVATKATHAPKAKAVSSVPSDASVAAPSGQAVGAKPAPVCAPSAAQLAQEAGLSPAELQVLQSLGARRGQLDEREQGLDTQLALIAAAETKVDAKIATMNGLKADMQAMLGQLDDKQEAEVARLVKVFEAMKPADSAARFVLLSDEVRLPIAAKMKERVLSAMLAKMPPPEAKRLTESLAARYVAQADAARAAINPPPVSAAAAAAAAKPAKMAEAGPSTAPADASAPPAAAPVKPVHRKAHTVHHPAAAVASATPKPAKAAPAAGSAAGTAKPETKALAGAPGPASPAPAPAKSAPPATPPAATPPAPVKAG